MFALGFTAISAQADADRRGKRNADPAEREAKMLERMTEALDLTDAQVVQIQEFQAENKELRKAEMESAETREERGAILKKYAARADENMNAVLDEAQRTKYAQFKERMKERAQDGRGERGGRRRGGRGK